MTNLMTDDELKDYQRTRSPDAFRRLVDRYVDLVYAAARRQVRDAALAEDVTQAVFTILADKAGTLDPDRPLSAWLLRVTAYAAANARRARARQTHHERKAAEMTAHRTTFERQTESNWDDWSPLLDEGINRLRPADRDAIVLRYFEQKSSREVAASLGITEEAAAKRIERAVRKLRDFFARRGATVSAAALATTLAARSTEAAPPHLAASIGTAGAAATGVLSIAKGALVAMAYAKTKTALLSLLAGALLVGGTGIVVVKSLVTPDPGITPSAKPTPSAAGPLPSVTFSDNSTATLVAIADNPNTGRWWAPDGSPLPAAPAQMPPNTNNIWTPKDNHAFYMVVSHEGPAIANTFLAVGVQQPHQSDGNTGQAFGPTRVIGYTVAVPDQHPAVDLDLSISRGTWPVDEHYALPAGAPASPNPSLRIDSLADDNGNATVTVSRLHPNPAAGEEQVVVISSADHREHSYNSASSNGDGIATVYRFPLPKDQALTLVHRWRPFETHQIRNISLRPGTKTDVTISK